MGSIFKWVWGLLLCLGCGEVEERPSAGQNAAAAEQSRELGPVGGDIPRDAWPESWFTPPRKASELGLASFRQAPMLEALVAAGELPPVAERLPDEVIINWAALSTLNK